MTKLRKVDAAVAVYKKKMQNATKEELSALGFKEVPAMEYLTEKVLYTLADAYLEHLNIQED